MRLSIVLPLLFALGAISKTLFPATHLRYNGLMRRRLPAGRICRFFDYRSLLLNDSSLYIDYAYMTTTADDSGINRMAYLEPPYFGDLSEPYKTLESHITPENETNSSVSTKFQNPDKTWKVPATVGGALYFGRQPGDRIVKYGGRYSDYRAFNNSHSVGKNEWWTLDNESLEWTTIKPGNSEDLLRADGMASVNVPAQGLAFSIGGLVSGWTDSTYKEWNLVPGGMIALKSMLIYDTRKHAVKNVTISPLPAQWGGVVEYVPVGKKGVLVLIGGFESEKTAITPSDKTLKDMSKIHLYDIDAQKWHTQTTYGSTPEKRAFACASVASAPDNSSHNIFVHGGTDGSTISYSDTYVLSLPSFEWIKADSGSDTQSRLGHNCHMTTRHKILVTGGRGQDQEIPTLPSWINGECDKYPILNVFDVNNLRWQDSWDPKDGSTRFKVHKVITTVIEGSDIGGATVKKPRGGWDSEAVRELFTKYSRSGGVMPAQPSMVSLGQVARADLGTILWVAMIAIATTMVA